MGYESPWEELEEEALEERGYESVRYVCMYCGKEYTLEHLIRSGTGLVCENCSSRIFMKPRGTGRGGKPRKIWAI